MHKKFTVKEMSCAACSARVEKCVSALAGVNSVSVNLVSAVMNVDYDEELINQDLIIKAVTDAGYPTEIYVNNRENLQLLEMKRLRNRFVLSLLFFIPLMYVAMYHMFPHPYILHQLGSSVYYGIVQIILLTPIVAINFHYYKDGFLSFFRRSPNMNSLIAVGSGVTIIYGIYCIVIRINNFYLESAGMILTLITLGKFLESKAKLKTKNSVQKLYDLTPKTAIIEKNGEEVTVSAERVNKGDILVIKNGFIVPADGVIIEGNVTLDQSVITGEGMPVDKTVGEKVISATTVINGYAKVKAENTGEETVFSKIVETVETAMSTKAPIAKLADKVSGYFVPAVILLSIITFVVWKMTGMNFEFSFSAAVSVLVISCPCALGLATPVSVTVGMGKGAQNGILIKNAEILETAHKADIVFLDKTGTVTEGKPYVKEIVSFIAEKELLKIIASLEKMSEHVISKAIIDKYNSADYYEVLDFEVKNGVGISGIINGKKYFAGSRNAVANCNGFIEPETSGTVIYLTESDSILGYVLLDDKIKETSRNAIKELSKMNVKCIMLTGDNKKAAAEISENVGIQEVYSDLMPEDKMKIIRKFQSDGKVVAMVGDGVNDAPALAAADIGIAIGAGTDVAIECADIVLSKNNLEDVAYAILLSKETLKNVKQNLFWAFFYNILCIPVAAGVLYKPFGILLNPMIASGTMMFSSLFVLSNALRLNLVKIGKKLA